MRPEEIIAASRELVEVDHYFEKAFVGKRDIPIGSRLTKHGERIVSQENVPVEKIVGQVPQERRVFLQQYIDRLLEQTRRLSTETHYSETPIQYTPFGKIKYVKKIGNPRYLPLGAFGTLTRVFDEPDQYGGIYQKPGSSIAYVWDAGTSNTQTTPNRLQRWIAKRLKKRVLKSGRSFKLHEQEHMRQYFQDLIQTRENNLNTKLLRELGALVAEKHRKGPLFAKAYAAGYLSHFKAPYFGFSLKRRYRELCEKIVEMKPRLSERQRRILAKALYHHEIATLEDAEKIIEFVERNPQALQLRH